MALTEKRIRDLKPRDRNHIEWDDEIVGLGVRITPAGAKAYVLNYRINGRSRRMTLAKVSEMKLADARSLAAEYMTQVRRGTDPMADREGRRTAPTVADLCDRYLDEHAKPKKSARSAREDERQIAKYLRPALGNRKVADIDFEDIERLHRKMKATPYQANRVLALASKMFQLAEKWKLRPPHTNPCRLVERFKEASRERYFSPQELKAIGAALVAVEEDEKRPANPFAVLALRLAMFLGLRIGEVASLRWENVDLESGTLRLPETKTGARTHTLPSPAQALLATAPRLGECVIPGRDPNAPLNHKAIHKVWDRVRKLAKLEDARIHDIRHTVATMAAETGAGAHLVRDLIGHKTLAMANLYVGRMNEPVRDLREKVAGAIDAAMSGGTGHVIQIVPAPSVNK